MSKQKKYITNYNFSKLSNEKLIEIIKKEGKTVNQRFRQLEKSGYTEASHMYKYNESKAFDNTGGFYRINKKGKFSYSTATKKLSHNKLVSLATEIHRSFEAKSGTVTNIKNSYQQATEKINKEYNVDFKPHELGELFRVANTTNFPFGSDEVIKLRKKTGFTQDELIEFLENNSFTRNDSFIDLLESAKTWKEDRDKSYKRYKNK